MLKKQASNRDLLENSMEYSDNYQGIMTEWVRRIYSYQSDQQWNRLDILSHPTSSPFN